MKDFYNISEAIAHHKNCYGCGAVLTPNFHGDPISFSSYHSSYYENKCFKINLSAMVDSDTDDILTIDDQNNVSLESTYRYVQRDDTYVSGTGLTIDRTKRRVPTSRHYAHLLFESIEVSCRHCGQFRYVIQLMIDVEKHKKALHLFLNSEQITIKDGDTAHDIRNIYATGQTEYRHNTIPHQFGKVVSFPIIPLDLKNPQETLNRIKNLLPFL